MNTSASADRTLYYSSYLSDAPKASLMSDKNIWVYVKPDLLNEDRSGLSALYQIGVGQVPYEIKQMRFSDSEVTTLYQQNRLQTGNKIGLDRILSSKSANYTKRINGKRNDGIYFDAPYRVITNSVYADAHSKEMNNWKVKISGEIKTNRATYVRATDMSGKYTFWIDKRGLK